MHICAGAFAICAARGLQDCREERLPRTELLSEGRGEITIPTGALTEHIKGHVLSFQPPY